jgi:hypothetical protein
MSITWTESCLSLLSRKRSGKISRFRDKTKQSNNKFPKDRIPTDKISATTPKKKINEFLSIYLNKIIFHEHSLVTIFIEMYVLWFCGMHLRVMQVFFFVPALWNVLWSLYFFSLRIWIREFFGCMNSIIWVNLSSTVLAFDPSHSRRAKGFLSVRSKHWLTVLANLHGVEKNGIINWFHLLCLQKLWDHGHQPCYKKFGVDKSDDCSVLKYLSEV